MRVERRIYVEHPDYDQSDRLQQRIPDVSVIVGTGTSVAVAGSATVTLAEPIDCDVPIPIERRESYLLIKATKSHEVITVIELLSPSNKRPGSDGRREYLTKRDEVLAGATHLVELDLLRGGERLPLLPPGPAGDYFAIVSRAQRHPRDAVYAWQRQLADRLPTISIPLSGSAEFVPLDLMAAVKAVYERVQYGLSIDYRESLRTSLADSQGEWLKSQLGNPTAN